MIKLIIQFQVENKQHKRELIDFLSEVLEDYGESNFRILNNKGLEIIGRFDEEPEQCCSCEDEFNGFNYVSIPFGEIDLFVYLCDNCLKKSGVKITNEQKS